MATSILVDTPSTSKITLLSVKLNYDRGNRHEVLATMRRFYPDMDVKDFTPEMIAPFIIEGADPVYWQRELKFAAKTVTPSKPKAKRKRHYEPKRKESRSAPIAFGNLRARAGAV